MAVRLRPRNAEEEMADADFGDCVELQPEVHSFYLIYNCVYNFCFVLIYRYSLDCFMHDPFLMFNLLCFYSSSA